MENATLVTRFPLDKNAYLSEATVLYPSTMQMTRSSNLTVRKLRLSLTNHRRPKDITATMSYLDDSVGNHYRLVAVFLMGAAVLGARRHDEHIVDEYFQKLIRS